MKKEEKWKTFIEDLCKEELKTQDNRDTHKEPSPAEINQILQNQQNTKNKINDLDKQIEILKDEELQLGKRIEIKKAETFTKMNEKNNYEVEVETDDTSKNTQADAKDTLQSIEQNYVDICINIDLLLSTFKCELNKN